VSNIDSLYPHVTKSKELNQHFIYIVFTVKKRLDPGVHVYHRN